MRQIVTLVALLILSPLALAQKPPAGKVSAPSDSGGGGSHGISGPLYLDIAIHVTSSSASVQGQSQTLALNQQGISLTLAPKASTVD